MNDVKYCFKIIHLPIKGTEWCWRWRGGFGEGELGELSRTRAELLACARGTWVLGPPSATMVSERLYDVLLFLIGLCVHL